MIIQPHSTMGLTAVLAGCLFAQVASAQTFGSSGGELFEDDAAGFSRVAAGCEASGVAIQADRKIVGVGTHVKLGDDRVIVVRFHADGALDTSFGEKDDGARAGFAQLRVGTNCKAESVAIDPDSGAIFVVGSANFEGKPNAFVVRLTSDGVVDELFQDDGVLAHRFESQVNEGDGFGLQPTWGTDIEIDLSGNFVIAGRTGAPRDHEAFVARFNSDGELDWSQKHGTGGFDDGANAISVPLKSPPYRIYTTGFSTITNMIKAFDHDGTVQIGQSSLGFCVRSFGISYDESTDRVVCAGNLGNDLVVRAMNSRPEVIPNVEFRNPFKEKQIDSHGRAIQHLANGRVAVVGHGRPYDAKDNTDRHFQFALYGPDAKLIAHDSADLGGGAAALDVAVYGNSLIAVAGRVMTKQVTPESANFKMGFVLYDGDGKTLGRPWTFELVESARVERQ
jgi:uncharacterized delta-60 repeat protein